MSKFLRETVTIRGFSEIGTNSQDYGKGVIRARPEFATKIGVRGRHNLVRIQSSCGSCWITAVLRMNRDLKSSDIALEYDQRRLLDVKKGESYELVFSKAGTIGWWVFFWNHPSIEFRMMSRMTIIVAVLSAVAGFLLSMILNLMTAG